MSRQSDQLEILHNKLSYRYGLDDALCAQISAALASSRKFQTSGDKKHDWSVPYEHTIAAHRQATRKTSHH